MNKRYSGDPYWLTVKYDGQCTQCKRPVKRGERAFYYPQTKALLSGGCGEQAARDFYAQVADEENNRCL